ncbi:succinate dehydrogenase, hydrophobic membrane anchor protein [Chromatium okenii]|uniref:succinate dehydrogenase, hydrophobic membrane anchor protein n=1 Tax=Chromatium okenii TaxID=61644 RepID=UPI0026F28BA2|nr:succinate dehydrogenase, hydrophobic membrane anchor protein [Chromatium okenii]MBV5308321.1 succinate dehydrogenase, hydrophobic membrane anchor protein [Chromatium okenii]MBV5311293.1 succinate dehydrogenase, hydrophobic membrane anchor protein [Chromatium okenii]
MSRHASGLMAWLIQRASAVYLALFMGYLLIHFIFDAPATHAALVAWIKQPLIASGLLLWIPLLLAHAWVGIRDVLLDYVHPLGLRLSLLMLFGFIFIASGLWLFKAIITAGVTA